MRRSLKFLLRPTRHQEIALAACLQNHRQLCNAALEHRRTAYAKAGVSIRYGDQSAELKHIRGDDPDGQGRWSFSSQQAALRRLDKAFAAFFTRARQGRTPGFPRFKGRGRFDSVTWPKDDDGCRVANPRHLAATAGRLAAGQRDLARKKWGSQRRRKAVAHLATLHAKARRQRLDGAHKAALALVHAYDMITHEDLRITNMTRSASDTVEQPGRNGAAKSGLDRSILDPGWGVFLTILADKAESAGRKLIAANPAHTSHTCARCGHRAKDNRPTQAEFACTACGHAAHADVNAAINILRAGLALRQAAQAA